MAERVHTRIRAGWRWSLVGVLLTALLVAVPVPAGAALRPNVARFAGIDRADTARLIATDDSPYAGRLDADTVVVTRSDIYPDGLAGAYLAGRLAAPILLTSPNQVSPPTAQAVAALDPTTVVVLGSEVAVSEAVARSLAGDRGLVRIGGEDRYETAAMIALAGGPLPGHGRAIVSSGANFPDALVAAAIAAGESLPLLLTRPEALPDVTADALQQLGVREVVLTGGTAAVSATVEQQLRALGLAVVRVAGVDRYATATALADLAQAWFGWEAGHVNLATGERFPDALALGPHAGLDHRGPAPILLTRIADLPDATANWLRANAGCRIDLLHVAGSVAAVSDAAVDQAVAAMTVAGCPDDVTGPDLRITSHADGQAVALSGYALTLAGTVRDTGVGVAALEVRVGGGYVAPVPFDGRQTPHPWSVDLWVPDDGGVTDVEVVATDGEGNRSTRTVRLTVTTPRAGDTVLAPDAAVLTPAEAGRVRASDPDTGRVTFPTGQLPAGVDLGTVIAIPPTGNAPGGAFGRVVAIEVDGASTHVTLAPVPITEAVHQVSVDVRRPLDPSQGSVQVGSGVSSGVADDPLCGISARESPLDGGQGRDVAATVTLADYRHTFDRRVLRAPGGAAIAVEGSAALKVTFDIGLDIGVKRAGWGWAKVPVGAKLNHFHVELSGAEEVGLLLEAEVNGSLGTLRAKLLEQRLGTITIPAGVPIPVDVDLLLHVGADGTVAGAAGVRVSQSGSFTAGVAYDRGEGWEDRSANHLDTSFEVDRAPSASFTVRGFVDVSLQLGTTGVGWVKTGLQATATARPYLKVVAGTGSPTWRLAAGLDGLGQVEAKALGFEVVDETWSANVFERTLVTSDDVGSGSDPTMPLIVPPTQDRSLAEALFHANVCDASLLVEWTSDVDGLFATGPIARGSLTPGRHDITVRVWDDGGLVGIDSMVFDQSNFECVGDGCRSEWFGHFDLATVVPAASQGARALADSLGDPDIVTGASFDEVPNSPGNEAHGLARRVPGMSGGGDGLVPILTTGEATDAPRLNTTGDVGHAHGNSVLSTYARDATVLAVDLDIPEEANCLEFDFRFFSEEYPEYTAAGWTDRFAAQVDTWSLSVPSDGASAPGNLAADASGDEVGVQSPYPTEVSHLMGYGTTFDAATRVLRASGPITPGAHTLYLTIFDHTDELTDSMVAIDGLRATTRAAGACQLGAVVRS